MEKQTQGRGQLTERIKVKSVELMGREILMRELRLMVYVQYVMVNDQRLGNDKLSGDEREILEKWEDEGYVTQNTIFTLQISKKFWDIISEITWLGYVDLNK